MDPATVQHLNKVASKGKVVAHESTHAQKWPIMKDLDEFNRKTFDFDSHTVSFNVLETQTIRVCRPGSR